MDNIIINAIFSKHITDFIVLDNDINISQIQYFNKYIINGLYFSEDEYTNAVIEYINSKRLYNSLQKYSYKFKKRHSKKYENDTDLYGTPFIQLKSNILYNYFDSDNRIIYTFRITDLINIINDALSYSPNFFVECKTIKNPYTNIEFNISSLYNIYYAIKNSTYLMPFLFHQYFKNNFDMTNFIYNNESNIRDYNIENTLTKSSEEKKCKLIRDMFIYYQSDDININISPYFPNKILIKVFERPFLKLYLQDLYSLNPTCRHLSNTMIRALLKTFSINNPNFGVAEIFHKRDRNNRVIKLYRFNLNINIFPPENSNLNNDAVDDIGDVDDVDHGDDLDMVMISIMVMMVMVMISIMVIMSIMVMMVIM